MAKNAGVAWATYPTPCGLHLLKQSNYMKIISKFKDFYDFKVAKYGTDPILVFDRRARADLPAPKHLSAPLPDSIKIAGKGFDAKHSFRPKMKKISKRRPDHPQGVPPPTRRTRFPSIKSRLKAEQTADAENNVGWSRPTMPMPIKTVGQDPPYAPYSSKRRPDHPQGVPPPTRRTRFPPPKRPSETPQTARRRKKTARFPQSCPKSDKMPAFAGRTACRPSENTAAARLNPVFLFSDGLKASLNAQL